MNINRLWLRRARSVLVDPQQQKSRPLPTIQCGIPPQIQSCGVPSPPPLPPQTRSGILALYLNILMALLSRAPLHTPNMLLRSRSPSRAKFSITTGEILALLSELQTRLGRINIFSQANKQYLTTAVI